MGMITEAADEVAVGVAKISFLAGTVLGLAFGLFLGYFLF